jgi:UDP-N-acetylglucosamine transferase subunit ALG13
VGNAFQPFERLLKGINNLCKLGRFEEEVFVQTGHNEFNSNYFRSVPFLTREEFENYLSNANAIITHGGAGTILQVFKIGKVPIVIPRRKAFGEHVNDHQVELVQAFENLGRLVVANEPEDIPNALAKAKLIEPPVSSVNPPILQLIESSIEKFKGVS